MLLVTCLFIGIATGQRRQINRLRREKANRPIGRIISSELTKDGLLMHGEIFDDSVWKKMAADLPGMSIGYSVDSPTPPPTVPLVWNRNEDPPKEKVCFCPGGNARGMGFRGITCPLNKNNLKEN
jgi:hypothetical protein